LGKRELSIIGNPDNLLKKLIFIALIVFACSKSKPVIVIESSGLSPAAQLGVPEKLSSWGFFTGELKALQPDPALIPYDLNTPLFSDYSHKARFVKLPENMAAQYNSTEVMDFPLGTVLIKNFYYPADFSQPEGDRRILETRLLIHERVGWNALTYVWTEDQKDAVLTVSGQQIPVEWKDETGQLRKVSYSVPNLVQCKSCHEMNGRMVPIGPTARQLNRDFHYKTTTENQLVNWQKSGILGGLPDPASWPKLAVWNDPKTGDLSARARAWLEINCAHCHRAEGPAKNTGFYLTANETDPYKLGIYKTPVAAGRGSGGLKYALVPGDPKASILYYRIASTDPGVMMPEVGRKINHEEGIALVKVWIEGMDKGTR